MPAATIRLVPAQVHAHANANANASDGDGGGEHAAAAAAVFEDPDYKNSRLWDQKEPYALIGRLATRKEFRGRGYGRVLVEEALRWAGAHKGDMERELRDGEWKGLLLAHAQARLEKWYQGLGWRTDEGMGRWAEAGIQHVGMWRRVEITG